MADYIYSMETRLTPDQQKGVNLVQEIARHAGLNLYLTGGSIRDLVTGLPDPRHRPQRSGQSPQASERPGEGRRHRAGVEEDLQELQLLMPGNVRAELNMARSEMYDKPGKPPVISPATINEDLRRRDFTVNAMALSLNPGSRGLLLDPLTESPTLRRNCFAFCTTMLFWRTPSRLIRAIRLCPAFIGRSKNGPRRATIPPRKTTTSSTSISAPSASR